MPALLERKAALRCHYKNRTSHLHMVRLCSGDTVLLERVVFPEQHITFDGSSNDYLEVSSAENPSSLVQDRLSCERLQVL